jgi:hypothetical protein
MKRKTFGWLACALAGTILSGSVAAQGTAAKARTEQDVMIWTTEGGGAAFPGEDTFIFVSGEGAFSGGRSIKGAPYSAEGVTESLQTLPDGNRIVKRHSILIYRDNEGRTRRESSLKSLGPWATQGEPARMVTIIDPVAGVSYTLNPRNRTATKVTFGPGNFGVGVATGNGFSFSASSGAGSGSGGNVRMVTGNGSQAVLDERVAAEGAARMTFKKDGPEDPNRPKVERRTEDLGTQTVEGVSAKGKRHVTVYPAGYFGNERPLEVVSESWFSDELQTMVMTKHSDPRTGETTYRLTNINRSNPDKSLFEPPADYKIEESKIRATFTPRAAPPPPPAPVKPE